MRTSGKVTPGGAMRCHSASLTVLVVGTMRPSLVTVAALELGDALEAHQLAELLEVVQRRGNAFAGAVLSQCLVYGIQRSSRRQEAERREDGDLVADVF